MQGHLMSQLRHKVVLIASRISPVNLDKSILYLKEIQSEQEVIYFRDMYLIVDLYFSSSWQLGFLGKLWSMYQVMCWWNKDQEQVM